MLKTLSISVKNNWMKENHNNSINLIPPLRRDTAFVFLAYCEENIDKRYLFSDNAMSDALSHSNVKYCIVIGYNIDKSLGIYFYHSDENHEALGIECSDKYSLSNTGYCFVESTAPSIITDSEGKYGIFEKLTNFEVIEIADGSALQEVSEEYQDKLTYYKLMQISNANNGLLESADYKKPVKVSF